LTQRAQLKSIRILLTSAWVEFEPGQWCAWGYGGDVYLGMDLPRTPGALAPLSAPIMAAAAAPKKPRRKSSRKKSASKSSPKKNTPIK
jgi:hypothetical protein